ncbi:MAG: ATP-dependent Clp protease adaptor ClpS, partial [Anaerolineae bacterium]|nr:ATP-dependent Clp protease adaptor ClpS [Anaerolineae bacterium]
ESTDCSDSRKLDQPGHSRPRVIATTGGANYNPLMILDPVIQPEIGEDTEQSEAFDPPVRVYVHNDDVTPYEFVVIVLQRFFGLNPLDAEQVTYTAHLSGIAYVVTLPKSEAQQKVGQAHFAAGLEGYPLTFTIESE